MKFQHTYEIDYQSLYGDWTVTFQRLMYHAQETSIRHTDSTSLPIKWYMEKNWAWIITNWFVKIFRYPGLGEKITITTFPHKFKGVIGERWFEAFDACGKILMLAFSSWMLADLKLAKPIRPPADMLGLWETFPEPADRKSLFAEPRGEKILSSSRKFIVTRRDLDSNNHVNNIKYIEWAFDDVPDEFYKARKPEGMKAVYRRQCFRGDEIGAEFYAFSDDPDAFVTIFKNAEGSVLAEICSRWKKA